MIAERNDAVVRAERMASCFAARRPKEHGGMDLSAAQATAVIWRGLSCGAAGMLASARVWMVAADAASVAQYSGGISRVQALP